jgi:putative ABC transport system permease protein
MMISKKFNCLKAEKQNNIIQITGLVLGIVTCIFVGQYTFFEYSFDRFNNDNQLIYRTKETEGMRLGTLAKEQLSYIENSARLHPSYRGVTIVDGKKGFYENNAYFADGSLFDIFTFPIIKGEAKEALSHKNQMVISEKYAIKYFGNENPVGKTLLVNGAYESNVTYTVTGVFKDIPQNSHLQFNILFSIENILANQMYTKDEPWRWQNFFTYFKTNTPLDIEKFTSDLTTLAFNNGMPEKPGQKDLCKISALNDIHLNGQNNYMDNNPNASDINIRILIAFIIMAIAWLNFINIGIGSTLKNKMALGMKRILGASPVKIWSELFHKSFIINLIAFAVSTILFIFLNYILHQTGLLKPISLSLSWQVCFWVSIFCMQIIGVFLVSTSIHLLLNQQKSIEVLSNRSITTKKGYSPWITLFVLQFGASIVLISFALFSTRQVNGIINMNKGIQTNQILAIHSANYAEEGDIEHIRSVFEEEVQKISGVTAASSASYIPGSTISSYMPTRLAWKNNDANISCRMNFVGYDYLPLFGHKLIAGRNFSKDYSADGKGIIINETLAKAYGYGKASDAIGKEIFWEFRNESRNIIGVMEDFHHQSAEMPVEPTMFQLWDHARGYCLLKISAANPLQTIKSVEKLWAGVHGGNAFDYVWIDEHYQNQFNKWLQFVLIVKVLSLIAILIACMGLFGLSSMLLNKRTKEIGIRKVNGAKISEVMVMLNREFVKWVVIAFVIATPIAYYTMNKWLENFAYKTELSWWIFALAGLLALGIALLTVSWQSWRAARRNPVEALRYE